MFKKAIVVIATVLAVSILLLVGLIAVQPAEYSVERRAIIDAPADVVFDQVDQLHRWEKWSPWIENDPDLELTYEGPDRGEDAVYEWSGDSDSGAGRMTIVDSRPHEYIELELEFIEPFESTSTTAFAFAEGDDEGTTEVTWSMSGENTFMSKAFGLFFDMEDLIGDDYERGLANLGEVASSVVQDRNDETNSDPPDEAASSTTDDGTPEIDPETDEQAAVDSSPIDLTLEDWRAPIEEQYAHMQLRSVEIDERTFGHCERIRDAVDDEVLTARVSSPDEKRFADLSLEISPVDDENAAYEAYAAEADEIPDFCVSKEHHLVVIRHGWLLELQVPCRAGDLVHYELGDFLTFVDTVLGTPDQPRDALFSRCGQMKLNPVTIAELRERSEEERTLWG